MPQTPDQQKAIVQRMIDAGETEENIATVIRHFKSAPAAAQPKSTSTEDALGGVVTDVMEFGKGVLKSGASLVETGGNLIRKIPGVAALENATGAYVDTDINTKPENTAQTVGKIAGDVGMAFVPGGMVTRSAKALSAAAPRGLGVLARVGTEAAGAAAIGGAQGYDPTVSGLVGGGLAGAGAAVRGVRGALRNPNAVEREALEYVAGKGVPVDAGTMSGNAALKGIKYGSDKTIPGSIVATKAAKREAEGLATVGEQLAAKAHPSAVTAETAGRGVTEAVEQRAAGFNAEANAAYDTLRGLEKKRAQEIAQVGAWKAPESSVKAFTKVPLAVDLVPTKKAMYPVYKALQRKKELVGTLLGDEGRALTQLDALMEAPGTSPLSVADAALSDIKALARVDKAFQRTAGQGVAAEAVKSLEKSIQAAAREGGPDVWNALMKGRAATVNKHKAIEVLETLRAEPVKAFKQATTPQDAAIRQLREIAREAPNELPKIGRAYLDDMLQNATSEGGFKGAQGMAAQWAKLGPQTKAMLFGKTPGLTAELDKFFLAAKRLAENPNPSGTAGVAISNLGIAGGLMANNIVSLGTLAGLQAQGYVLSKALRDPRVVRLLTQGMSAKPNTVTGRVTAQALQKALAPYQETP